MATQTVLHVYPGAEAHVRRGDDVTTTITLRDPGTPQVILHIPCDVAEQLCGRIADALDGADGEDDGAVT